MNMVNMYIDQLEEPKNMWVYSLVHFMRDMFPELEECFDYKMPTYKGEGFYIAFAAQKNYFSFYTDDVRVLPLLKELMPSTSLGKGCARIKYNLDYSSVLEALMDVCKEIVDYQKSKQSPAVSDMAALRKWSNVPKHIQQLLVDNVFCAKCGVTTIVNYGIHDARFGIVLKGDCKICGQSVARVVEEE